MDYQLVEVKMEEKEEIMNLYRIQFGSDGCTWDETYPGMDLIENDIRTHMLFGVKNEEGRFIATIAWDADELVAQLPCWNSNLKKVAEYARLCIHPDYQGQHLTNILFGGSEQLLKEKGYDGAHYIVSQTNPRALRAYKKFAYTCKGEVRLFDHDWYAYEKEF